MKIPRTVACIVAVLSLMVWGYNQNQVVNALVRDNLAMKRTLSGLNEQLNLVLEMACDTLEAQGTMIEKWNRDVADLKIRADFNEGLTLDLACVWSETDNGILKSLKLEWKLDNVSNTVDEIALHNLTQDARLDATESFALSSFNGFMTLLNK